MAEVAKWPTATLCKSVVHQGFGGSNPPLSTKEVIYMEDEKLLHAQLEADPFGLRKRDFRARIPEKVEIFEPGEAKLYAIACGDDLKTFDYKMVSAEIAHEFGNAGRISGVVVEVCPGPGNLCGELLDIGAQKVIGVDGSPIMIDHASNKFRELIADGRMEFVPGMAQQLPLPNNAVAGIVNFNSFHQFANEQRAFQALQEMARVLKPGGWGLVRDFKRGASLDIIEERLKHTKPHIVPFLIDSIIASFSSDEFEQMLKQIPNIESRVVDTEDPHRFGEDICRLIDRDPVAHWMDSLISQHVIMRKKV